MFYFEEEGARRKRKTLPDRLAKHAMAILSYLVSMETTKTASTVMPDPSRIYLD